MLLIIKYDMRGALLDLVNQKIDLGINRKNQLNESWLAMFGGWLEWVLKGAGVGKFDVTGTRAEVDSFLGALGGEQKYLDAVTKYGLNDPHTFQNKLNLMDAIGKFESETGIRWPIK